MFERSVATSRDSDTFSRNTATSMKIGGRIGGHRPQRGQLVRQELRRQHAIARIGAAAAVTREQRVDREDRVAHVRLRRESKHDVVERAVDIERAAQRLAPHPHDAEALRLGQHRARRHGEHELRAARDADDLEHALAAVDQRAQLHAGREQVRFGERFVDQHFVVARRIRPASRAQQHIVHAWLAIRRQRHQARRHRIGLACEIQQPDAGDARFERIDAGQRRQLDSRPDPARARRTRRDPPCAPSRSSCRAHARASRTCRWPSRTARRRRRARPTRRSPARAIASDRAAACGPAA